MSAIWDGDTGHVTITCTKNGAPVNLSATTTRTIIARNVETAVVTTLAEVTASSNLAGGVIVANAEPLVVGTYALVVRCVDAMTTATYPSADQETEVLVVRAKLDAA